MASPHSEKKVRTDDIASACSGYIHHVSQMKTSKNGNPYLNAKLQESDKITDIGGHKEKKMRSDLAFVKLSCKRIK